MAKSSLPRSTPFSSPPTHSFSQQQNHGASYEPPSRAGGHVVRGTARGSGDKQSDVRAVRSSPNPACTYVCCCSSALFMLNISYTCQQHCRSTRCTPSLHTLSLGHAFVRPSSHPPPADVRSCSKDIANLNAAGSVSPGMTGMAGGMAGQAAAMAVGNGWRVE